MIWVNVKNQSIFYKNTRFLLDVREKVLNSFKSNVFPIEDSTPDPTTDTPVFYTPKQTKAWSRIPKNEISLIKLNQKFVNEIRNDEENMISEIFREYFRYQNPSF